MTPHSLMQLPFELARQLCTTVLRQKTVVGSEDIDASIAEVLTLSSGEMLFDVEELREVLAASFSIFSESARMLVDNDSYREWLPQRKDEIQWHFWSRYREHLSDSIAHDSLRRLDELTDSILDHLIDPATPGPWDRRGMVVGQVQSGKTANYVGLINKAADAGFKLIIVLAGIHDALRAQTQMRVDAGFLGFNTQNTLKFEADSNFWIGVGLTDPNRRQRVAHALTRSTPDGDFRRVAAQNAGVSIHGKDPVVLVVKKNASILNHLLGWLAARADPAEDGLQLVQGVPLLLIDDEADNASINVSREGLSRINGQIRALLALFEQSAYVGYTATPFANIFIRMDDGLDAKGVRVRAGKVDFAAGADLFPRHFIINMPAPSNYIGPSKLFGLPTFTFEDQKSPEDKTQEPLPLVVEVSDYAEIIPNRHKLDDPLPEVLPQSLREAIRCFVLTCAARRARGQVKVHNSMLVHVTRFVKWQDRVASLVSDELDAVRNAIELSSPSVLAELEVLWRTQYEPITEAVLQRKEDDYIDPSIKALRWEQVRPELMAAVAPMQVRAVHGDKRLLGLSHHNIAPLDYFEAEQRKPPHHLSIIAVGGNKLSRGLTLEGLSVSYYLRASKMYDTLMQMGRWFGYRPGYVDLCRLYTSSELVNWYEHITVASEEMRREFDTMFFQRRTPRDYGLKVRTHPGALQITAANKFRNSRKMHLSYAGHLVQTWQMPLRPASLQARNIQLARELVAALGAPDPKRSTRHREHVVWTGRDNFDRVSAFIRVFNSQLRTRQGETRPDVYDRGMLADYIDTMARQGRIRDWTIVLINRAHGSAKTTFDVHNLTVSVNLTYRALGKGSSEDVYQVTKAQIISPEHEALDLTDAEYEEALERTKADWKKLGRDHAPIRPSGANIRYVRRDRAALLLLYPLTHADKRKDGEPDAIGLAFSFPHVEDDEGIEYAVNEQFQLELDYPEEFDDDDAEE